MMGKSLSRFAPLYIPPEFSHPKASWALYPFVTSLTSPVYSFRSHMLPPQMLGALFSKASRAPGDLRVVFWKEYIEPILFPREDTEEARKEAGEIAEFIQFYHDHKRLPYNTERAYQFFATNLAQYGDDSIAQMVSTNLVVCGLSQVAIKFLEDQRIGVAPIEKSTRYVNYGARINGAYMYYMDPRITEWGLDLQYRKVMDALFGTYTESVPQVIDALALRYPEEKRSVMEKKAFDVLRGFLPMATLSQVSWHGNAQAFKYMIDRCAKHPRGELRWFAKMARIALDEEIPALLLRLDDDDTKKYQCYLAQRRKRAQKIARALLPVEFYSDLPYSVPDVELVEYDKDGENKVLAGLLYGKSGSNVSWHEVLHRVSLCNAEEKQEIFRAHFSGRTKRWQKVGRAFENAYVRFEIVMNLGAYRDLHRHRMHTQDRQDFTVRLGYEVPKELKDSEVGERLRELMLEVSDLYEEVYKHDPEAAQDIPTLFHFVRFYQYQNLRQFFWEVELRTTSQGHPDYRHIEQEKFRLLSAVYPLICEYVIVDEKEYDFARRGQEERTAKKEEKIKERMKSLRT